MTAAIAPIDPLDHGYTRALWLLPGRHYLRPGGLSACSEAEAIAEIEAAQSADDKAAPQKDDDR